MAQNGVSLGIRKVSRSNAPSRGLRKIMNIKEIVDKVEKKIRKQTIAREEFDSFMIAWVEKHKLPQEAYRGISYLMSAYVASLIED